MVKNIRKTKRMRFSHLFYRKMKQNFAYSQKLCLVSLQNKVLQVVLFRNNKWNCLGSRHMLTEWGASHTPQLSLHHVLNRTALSELLQRISPSIEPFPTKGRQHLHVYRQSHGDRLGALLVSRIQERKKKAPVL